MIEHDARWREEFPVNAAIFKIAADREIGYRTLAEMLQVSLETVLSWRRTKTVRAPKMALALLCQELKLKPHALLR